MIFWPVLKKNRKEIAEIIRKILAMARDEKSVICMGQIKATIPKTKVAGTITAPIKSPRISQHSPFLAETNGKISFWQAIA